MWMGEVMGELSVINDAIMHSFRALSEGKIIIVGNVDGSSHITLGKLGRWNESFIEPHVCAIAYIST